MLRRQGGRAAGDQRPSRSGDLRGALAQKYPAAGWLWCVASVGGWLPFALTPLYVVIPGRRLGTARLRRSAAHGERGVERATLVTIDEGLSFIKVYKIWCEQV